MNEGIDPVDSCADPSPFDPILAAEKEKNNKKAMKNR
jgi:hypothetical protein